MWSGKITFCRCSCRCCPPAREALGKSCGKDWKTVPHCPAFSCLEPGPCSGKEISRCSWLEQGCREQEGRCQSPQLLVSTEALCLSITSAVAIRRTAGSLVCSGKAMQIQLPSSSLLGLYTVAQALSIFQIFFGVYSLSACTMLVGSLIYCYAASGSWSSRSGNKPTELHDTRSIRQHLPSSALT